MVKERVDGEGEWMPAPPLACPEGGSAAAAERALVARLAGEVRAVDLPADLPVAAGRVLEAGGMDVAAGPGGGGTGAAAGAGVSALAVAGEEGVMAADVASPGLTTASPAAALASAAPGLREAAALALALAAVVEERGMRLAMAGRGRGGSGMRRSGKESGNPPLPGANRRVPRSR